MSRPPRLSVWTECEWCPDLPPPALAVPAPSGLSVLCVLCRCLLHQLKKQEGFLLGLSTAPATRGGGGGAGAGAGMGALPVL